jgi:hypothetical protein
VLYMLVLCSAGQMTKTVVFDCASMPDIDYTIVQVLVNVVHFLWGRSSPHVTVGLCVDIVEIGTDRITTEPLRGGGALPQLCFPGNQQFT